MCAQKTWYRFIYWPTHRTTAILGTDLADACRKIVRVHGRGWLPYPYY